MTTTSTSQIKKGELIELDKLATVSDSEFFYLAFQIENDKRLAGEGISGRMHVMALQFNHHLPESPILAITSFENHLFECFRAAKADHVNFDAKLLGLSKDNKLTGNGPVANAFKQITNAWKYGGNLAEDFVWEDELQKKLDTVSKCRAFAQKAKTKQDAKEKRNSTYSAFEAQLKKEHEDGLFPAAPGTKEFNAEVLRRTNKQLSLGNPEIDKEESGTVELDQFDKLGQEFADQLRALAVADHGKDKQAIEMGQAAVRRVADAIQARMQKGMMASNS